MAFFGLFGGRTAPLPPPPSRPAPPSPSLRQPSRLGPKAPQKPVAPVAKPEGLFGEKGYRTFLNLREFAKKAPYVAPPKYGKKMDKKARVDLMNTLRQYSGSSYGITKQKYDTAVKKMLKEKMYTKDFKKKMDLDRKIKMLKKWESGK